MRKLTLPNLLKTKETFEKSFETDEKIAKIHFINLAQSQDVEALKLFMHNHETSKLFTTHELFTKIISLVRSDEYLHVLKLIYDKFNLQQLENPYDMNLLDEAAVYGSTNIVEFLLNTKKWNINHKDKNGDTAIHRAIYGKHIKTVELLINKGADLKLENKGHFTPIMLAAMTNQLVCIKMILASKKDIGTPKEVWKKIYLKTIEEKTSLLCPSLQLTNFNYIELAQGLANYYKALYNYENDGFFLIESINCFKKVIENRRGTYEKNHFYQALSTLHNIYVCIEYEDSKILLEYIISTALELKNNKLIVLAYNLECINGINEGRKAQAIKFGKLALELCKSDKKLSYLKGKIEYNLGMAYEHINNTKAIEHLDSAVLSDNSLLEEAYKIKFDIYFKKREFIKSREVVNKILDDELRDLLSIKLKYKTEKIQNDELDLNMGKYEGANKGSPEKEVVKFILYKEMIAMQYELKENYLEAIKVYADIINNTYIIVDPVVRREQLTKVLEIFKIIGNWQGGLEFIKKMYSEYMDTNLYYKDIMNGHQDLELTYLEFQFYEQNGNSVEADKSLEVLNSHAYLGSEAFQFASYANTYRVYTQIEAGEYNFNYNENFLNLSAKNKYLIKYLLDYDISKSSTVLQKDLSYNIHKHTTNDESQKLVFNEKITNENSENKNNFSYQNDTHVSENIVAELEWITTPKEIDSAFSHLTPKEIHEYFQQIKKALLQKKISDICSKSSVTYWIDAQGIRYDSSSTKKITDKSNYYGVISEKLLKDKKLDSKVIAKFENALTKNVVSNSKMGTEGIKFLNHKLIELKIQKDLHLYTNTIYKNLDGNYLIIFDRSGKHEEIKRKVSESTGIKICYSVEQKFLSDDSIDHTKSNHENILLDQNDYNGLYSIEKTKSLIGDFQNDTDF